MFRGTHPEAPVALAQADLGLTSEILEGLGQLVEVLLDVRGDLGGMAICPGGFHQDAARARCRPS